MGPGGAAHADHISCFNCGQLGHYASDCPRRHQRDHDHPPPPNGGEFGAGGSGACPASDPVNQPTAPCPKPPHAHAPPNAPTCLAADYHPSSFGEIGATEFLLDSAATAHIAHNRSLFENYTPCTDNSVVITGAGSLPVAGYGTVLVTDPDKNATFALHGVMHVPDCPVNIFSTTELNLEGGTFATTRSTATIRASSGNTLTTTQNYKGIFILPALLPSSVCFLHLTNDSLETPPIRARRL